MKLFPRKGGNVDKEVDKEAENLDTDKVKLQSSTLDPAILKLTRRLVFATRRRAATGITGRYRSAFRGRGMEFESVREYLPGDEVRNIDWKVTARRQHPYVKSFREERELTVCLLVDTSGSTFTASKGVLRQELIAQIGGTIASIALANNDRLTLLKFSEESSYFFPPRKGRLALWETIGALLSTEPRGVVGRGGLGAACEILRRTLRQHCVIFLLTDLVVLPKELFELTRRHEVTVCLIRDPREASLPDVGLVTFIDPESGIIREVDTSSDQTKNFVRLRTADLERHLEESATKFKLPVLEFQTSEPFFPILQRYFDRRSSLHRGVRSQRKPLLQQALLSQELLSRELLLQWAPTSSLQSER